MCIYCKKPSVRPKRISDIIDVQLKLMVNCYTIHEFTVFRVSFFRIRPGFLFTFLISRNIHLRDLRFDQIRNFRIYILTVYRDFKFPFYIFDLKCLQLNQIEN